MWSGTVRCDQEEVEATSGMTAAGCSGRIERQGQSVAIQLTVQGTARATATETLAVIALGTGRATVSLTAPIALAGSVNFSSAIVDISPLLPQLTSLGLLNHTTLPTHLPIVLSLLSPDDFTVSVGASLLHGHRVQSASPDDTSSSLWATVRPWLTVAAGLALFFIAQSLRRFLRDVDADMSREREETAAVIKQRVKDALLAAKNK